MSDQSNAPTMRCFTREHSNASVPCICQEPKNHGGRHRCHCGKSWPPVTATPKENPHE